MKNAFFDQVGVATAVKRTTRHADTLQVDTPHSRRRVSLVDGLKNQSTKNWLNCWKLFLLKTISSQELQVA